MKIKPSTRTRLIGYFGIAVTTLLTPGGKLISSALAAATVVGLASMNIPSEDEKTSNSAIPIAYTGIESMESGLLNVGDLSIAGSASDTLTPEMLASDQYAAQTSTLQENQAAFTIQNNTPSTNLASLNLPSDTANGGGLPSAFPFGPTSGPQFTHNPSIPSSPQGTPPLETLAPETLAPEKEDKVVTLDSISLPLEENPSLLGPEVIAPEVLVLPASSIPDTEDGLPVADQQIQPLFAIAAAEIPEPSTLGLFLLGLASFGWIYRSRTAQNNWARL